MIFQSFYAQEWSSSLDSIDFYKGFNPEKALKFGFEALERKDIMKFHMNYMKFISN